MWIYHRPSSFTNNLFQDKDSATLLGIQKRSQQFWPVQNLKEETDFEHRRPLNQWWLQVICLAIFEFLLSLTLHLYDNPKEHPLCLTCPGLLILSFFIKLNILFKTFFLQFFCVNWNFLRGKDIHISKSNSNIRIKKLSFISCLFYHNIAILCAKNVASDEGLRQAQRDHIKQ